jgi:SAM-dependent methyltransferase
MTVDANTLQMQTYLADHRSAIAEIAARFGVRPDVHPADMIFRFVATHNGFPDPYQAIQYYFADGRTSADRLQALVRQWLPDRQQGRLLEFASGYGCVTRHLLAKALSGWEIASADIHDEAVLFLQKLGGRAVPSASQPEGLRLQPFDVVFALSFFSHMPDSTFARWLKSLYDLVLPGGLLIFTTHGYHSLHHLGNPSFNRQGFWFKPDSEQLDLPGEQYGLMAVTPSYVCDRIKALPGGPRIAVFNEGLWWGHQDLWVVQRP